MPWSGFALADRDSHEPRIVLPAFVVRCDTTPDVAPFRVARPGYCVNENGEAIADPAANPQVPALEPNPELRWEAFDEYWRKIHGPKIVHVDGPGDTATGRLLRYEQQHRIPGGPTSAAAPPYRPQVDANGLLVTDPQARVADYVRPSFDGLAQLAFATRADFNAFFGVLPGDKYLEKIVPDEKVFLKGFVFNISEEHILIPDKGTRDPIILVKTLERGPQFTSREAFQARWLAERTKVVASSPTSRKLIERYAQLHNISNPADGAFYDPVGDRYDVVEVLSFANPSHLEEYLASPDYAKVMTDDARYVARTEFFTAVNYVIKNDERNEHETSPRRRHKLPGEK
ncbi:MAG: EthD domain-containing protein [Acidobacteria bacterium]|nr:EthD domain-containing protein [Acidobacteriota bacterium]